MTHSIKKNLFVCLLTAFVAESWAGGMHAVSSSVPQGKEEVTRIYVAAPSGSASDSASATGTGSEQQPYATVGEAARHVVQLRASGNHAPVEIRMTAGVYELEQPLRMDAAFNAPEDGTVTFLPWQEEGTVILSGGRHLSQWKEIEPNHWVAELPEVKNGQWFFRQLFAGDRRLTRARTPNEGFLLTKGGLSITRQRLENPTEEEKAARHWLSRCGFAYNDGDIRYWADWKNAEIQTYHSWECSWQAIQAIDTAKQEVYFTSPCRYPVGNFGAHMRYRIENLREALDRPGEWYLDREAGVLHLLTEPGEQPAQMNIHAPRLTRIVEVTGTDSRAAAHIRFDRIHFQYSAYQMGLYDIAPNWPAEIQKGIPYFPSDIRPGYTGAQAAPLAGASLELKYAQDIDFMQCRIRHLGAIGVFVSNGCESVRLQGCEVSDTGAGGIYIGLPVTLVEQSGTPKSEAPRNNVVSNCRIHDIGHVHPAAVGVWMAQTFGNRIEHNEISDVSYSGVSMGWTWSFDPNYTKDNRVAHNYIHHVAQTLGDAAGIYSLGDCEGSVYDGNYLDQIAKGDGVYGVVDAMGFDECSSKITIRNTVVGKVSGKVASFGRATSAELQTWENNNFDMKIERPVVPHRPELDPAQLTVEARFSTVSTFLNLSGRKEQRWVVRKNGDASRDGFYGMFIQGKQIVALMNIGGGNKHLYQIASENVLEDDCTNTAVMSYDGRMFRLWFNGRMVGEVTVGQTRVPGEGKLEIAPVSSNSLRKGVESVRILGKAVRPEEVDRTPANYQWKAPKAKIGLKNPQKVIREAGPTERYRKFLGL